MKEGARQKPYEEGLGLTSVLCIHRGGWGGWGCWSGKVTECAHWKATVSALISLWHDKTIRGWLLTKLDYSAPLLSAVWRVISWDSSTQGIAQHYEMLNHCAVVGYLLRGVLWNALHPLGHAEFPVTTSQKQLTLSLQYWHRSLPPIKRVTSFQSFWKSTAYLN